MQKLSKIKIYRDKVISIINGKNLVGVYMKYPHFVQDDDGTVGDFYKDVCILECSPQQANDLIKYWNNIKI